MCLSVWSLSTTRVCTYHTTTTSHHHHIFLLLLNFHFAELIFLDEPTSGLDSYAAKAVMESLKKLTWMGRTVICTIHQPSSEIFRLFDDIMLLAEGQTVYFGQAGSHVMGYFSGIGYKCPKFINPADYLSKYKNERT